ncbi:MAG: hypothetical protein DRI61_17180 [Chloroflexi bacterium]|nr:MAG: hypothetical protein DRI61_17180 [Chloroflexota bacterium]
MAEILKNTSPSPDSIINNTDLPKWLKVLYLFYLFYDESPLTIRKMLSHPEIKRNVSILELDAPQYLRQVLVRLRSWGCLYCREVYKYGPKEYAISKCGVQKLYRKGLITEEEYDNMVASIPLKLEGWLERRRKY